MSQVQLSERDKAFLQTLELTKMSFNLIKFYADVAEKNDNNKHIVVNLQYTMKYLYEQIQRMEAEWVNRQKVNDPATPLASTVTSLGALTADEALAIIRMRTAKTSK